MRLRRFLLWLLPARVVHVSREEAEHANVCSLLPYDHDGGHWWDEEPA